MFWISAVAVAVTLLVAWTSGLAEPRSRAPRPSRRAARRAAQAVVPGASLRAGLFRPRSRDATAALAAATALLRRG